MSQAEVFVSVDIEASGPTPSTGSLIAIGACLVDDPEQSLYLLIKPIRGVAWSEEAEAVHHLPREKLAAEGSDAAQQMKAFEDWLSDVGQGRQPVFVGWNAGFDWMFVADYFARFLGRNPFGIAPLDIKAYLMGRDRLNVWADTRRHVIGKRYGQLEALSHHALDDARQQAAFLRHVLEQDDQGT